MAGPAFRAAPVRVRVPATSANLGPGFDSFGLALALYDDVVVRVADSGLVVDVAGEGADDVPRDRRHLVVKAMRAAFDELGGQPRGLEVVCANRIPHTRGLGSSAAAIVAGVVAARSLVLGGPERLDDVATLALATSLEGHPDNVAACLFGGFTISWTDPSGPQWLRLDAAPDLAPVVFLPSVKASTAKVRKMLPESVPHADAAANSARAALLAHALTGRTDLLLAATEDRLHQHYRASAMPRSAALVERLRGDGIPAVISGAGPSVLAFAPGLEAADLESYAGKSFEVRPLPVDAGGAVLLPLG